MRNAAEIFVGKPLGRIRLGTLRLRKWKDNIKMDLREIEYAGMECIHLAEDGGRWRAVMNMITNWRILQRDHCLYKIYEASEGLFSTELISSFV
jgi:hypothetical protein